MPISRRYEYVDDSGALVQTAEVKVIHQGAELVFGLNATSPERAEAPVSTRHDASPILRLRMGLGGSPWDLPSGQRDPARNQGITTPRRLRPGNPCDRCRRRQDALPAWR